MGVCHLCTVSQNRSGSRQSIVATATPMTPEQEQALKSHLKAIAQILYDESDREAMKTRFRDRIDCAAANPDACEFRIRAFFIQTVTGTQVGKRRRLKSSLGEIEITTRQAQKLAVQSYRQLSPHLENCWRAPECECLLRASGTRYCLPGRHSHSSQNPAAFGASSDVSLT